MKEPTGGLTRKWPGFAFLVAIVMNLGSTSALVSEGEGSAEDADAIQVAYGTSSPISDATSMRRIEASLRRIATRGPDRRCAQRALDLPFHESIARKPSER